MADRAALAALLRDSTLVAWYHAFTAVLDMRKTLAINRLCLDFQRPENLIEIRVEELVMQLLRGEKTEPVTVCFDGTRYLLKDGFHRVEAARRLRRRRISAEVIPGTLEEMEAEFRQMMEAVKRDLRRDPSR